MSSAENMISNVRQVKNIQGWAKLIWYWRTHLDVFIEQYLGIPLKDTQHIEARAFGNSQTLFLTQSRGYGKTWIVAICCVAMAILYPGSPIAVVSVTAEQATLVLKKIDSEFANNENVKRQLDWGSRTAPVNVNRSKGYCRFSNGSRIQSYSLGTFLGSRAKIIVVDEAPQVKKFVLDKVVKPVRNTTRSHCVAQGIKDYGSKLVSITSACTKSNYFYEAFCDAIKKMGLGDHSYFACALNYESAARVGISPMTFFEKQRQTMPEINFQMEYNTVFVGAQNGTLFPFELTDKCRTLTQVEYAQPSKSTSQYVMALDIATSSAKHADNAVLSVLKLVARQDGSFVKKLVKMRSYHGKRLDALATQVRKQLVRFPNTVKVVFDYRGLGDAFPEFMSQPWTDPETQKEYPPLVIDTERSIIPDAVPLLRPCAADNKTNQQLVSLTTINFERQMIQIPVNSRYVVGNKVVSFDGDADDDQTTTKQKRSLTMQEKAIFIETDALVIEMGSVVAKETAAGNVIYDTAKSTQHKDRWSSLAMGLLYVAEMQDARKKKIRRQSDDMCAGVIIRF